ncbi:uncharacterized protein LOC129596233 [Paramacrobiotus metropolitanus]|uniref:uncharacterized protein LOC129596233 n=1 Tax=Paramacrobiotus metropolitanus TaxID=2943436 RepID=UPI00244562CA|nr:uncharacterized protein LOC129596233 [Paramacrobiotus metropolitanus]
MRSELCDQQRSSGRRIQNGVHSTAACRVCPYVLIRPAFREIQREWNMSDNKAEAFKKVELAFKRMAAANADVIPAGAESEEEETPNERAKPGIPAEPGYPAVQRETQYVCFNCRKPDTGHTTSQCRRWNSRRFQPRDGERAEKFKESLETEDILATFDSRTRGLTFTDLQTDPDNSVDIPEKKFLLMIRERGVLDIIKRLTVQGLKAENRLKEGTVLEIFSDDGVITIKSPRYSTLIKMYYDDFTTLTYRVMSTRWGRASL